MENRVALIIGNSVYSNITRLKNPVADADALARLLSGLQFEVIGGQALKDATRSAIQAAIEEFCKVLGRNSVGLFYFSGHGLQLGGANYICPIEVGTAQETHIESELVDMGKLLARMEAAETALNILILDACRSDPFKGRSFLSTSGLAPMQARKGTILSFATQPGNIALDGTGTNSPFAAALFKVLPKKGLDALQAFNEVGIMVRQLTGGQQVPWMSTSPIETRFFFQPSDQAGQADGGGEAGTSSQGSAWWKAAQAPKLAVTGLRVSVTAPGAHSSIQAAIDAAGDDETITIDPGTYAENLTIGKSLTLKSQGGPEGVIISGGLNLDAGLVVLQDLTVRPQTSTVGVYVDGASAEFINCRIERAADATPEELPDHGVTAVGKTVRVYLSDTHFTGFHFGVSAYQGAQVTLEGCEITGLCPRGEEASEEARGLVAYGSRMTASNCKISQFQRAIAAYTASEIKLTTTRVSDCTTGVIAKDDGSRCLLEECELSDVTWGVYTASGGGARVTKCDISYFKAGLSTEAGTITATRCKIEGLAQDAGRGIRAVESGIVEVDDCRVFGGLQGVFADTMAEVTIKRSEIFDVAGLGLCSEATSTTKLVGCNLHHSQRSGIWCEGKVSVDNCQIHDHREHGIFATNETELTVSNSTIYRNNLTGMGVKDRARADVSSCLFALQSKHGIIVMDEACATISGCIFRQNGCGALWAVDKSETSMTACDLRRNLVFPTYLADKPARLTEAANLVMKPTEGKCLGNRGSGGNSNTIKHSDFYYAEFGRVIDQVKGFCAYCFDEWSREGPQTSADGQEVKLLCSRSASIPVKFEPRGWRARIRSGFEGYYAGRIHVIQEVLFELRFEVTISMRRDEKTSLSNLMIPGAPRVQVTVGEEEYIDRYNHTLRAIGEHHSIEPPTIICRDQQGCSLLRYLEEHLTPS